MVVAGLAAGLSLPIFLPFAYWQWMMLDTSEVTVGAWLALAWYGLGTLALGSWLWYSGVSEAEGSIAAAFMGVMPASALVLSYVLLGEAFRWMHLLGFAVVFAGVLLISWEHARMSRHDDSRGRKGRWPVQAAGQEKPVCQHSCIALKVRQTTVRVRKFRA
ncbi:DMT family transporter [Mesorhizobium sp. WSM2239]|uniref:DMT family transporter n=2 Tax=unclassified Mesorhizobium TaxID=325217 RepID=A0AAU8D779_9HYPH